MRVQSERSNRVIKSFLPLSSLLFYNSARSSSRTRISRRSIEPSLQALQISDSYAMKSAREAGIQIRESDGKGLGAFATQRIAMGDEVGEYQGELLTQKELDMRYPKTWVESIGKQMLQPLSPEYSAWLESRRKQGITFTGNYLFAVGDENYACVDAEDPYLSNWCRFINHETSSSSKCNLKAFRKVGSRFVALRATRDIEAGEELNYDYGPGFRFSQLEQVLAVMRRATNILEKSLDKSESEQEAAIRGREPGAKYQSSRSRETSALDEKQSPPQMGAKEASKKSSLERLSMLKDSLEMGLITLEEYEEKRTVVLAEL